MNSFEEIIKHLMALIKDKNYSCGCMSNYTLSLIRAFIRYYRPDLIIHTGILWGKSTAHILDTLDSLKYENDYEESTDEGYFNFITNNRRPIPNTKLIAIDPDIFNLEIENAVTYLRGVYPKADFEYYKMKSDKFFELGLYPVGYNYLMGIVDGDHTVEGCKLDLVNLANLNAKIIIVDDIMWLPHLNMVCTDFAEDFNYVYTIFEFDSGIGLLVQK